MTLIAGIKSRDGIILAADTEEVIPQALRTNARKIRTLYDSQSDWEVLAAGAGDVDYIRMIGDLIQEKIAVGSGLHADISRAIRETVHEVWRDHVRYEQSAVSAQMLFASWSHDGVCAFTVTNNAAVRDGRELEACGIGDATFRSLADRYLNKGLLPVVGGDIETLRTFVVFAMQRAKQTIPGVGGGTSIVTLGYDGQIKWEKSFKVIAIQEFFSTFDSDVLHILGHGAVEPEKFISMMAKSAIQRVRKLRKEIARIEVDPSLM